nr:MAG TPA: hypothetical protein [Bacteriophage sp.]
MLSLQLKMGLSCEIMTYFCASRWKCSFILVLVFLGRRIRLILRNCQYRYSAVHNEKLRVKEKFIILSPKLL